MTDSCTVPGGYLVRGSDRTRNWHVVELISAVYIAEFSVSGWAGLVVENLIISWMTATHTQLRNHRILESSLASNRDKLIFGRYCVVTADWHSAINNDIAKTLCVSSALNLYLYLLGVPISRLTLRMTFICVSFALSLWVFWSYIYNADYLVYDYKGIWYFSCMSCIFPACSDFTCRISVRNLISIFL